VCVNNVELMMCQEAAEAAAISRYTAQKGFHAKCCTGNTLLLQPIEVAVTCSGAKVPPVECTDDMMATPLKTKCHTRHLNCTTRSDTGVRGQMQNT